MSWQGVLSQYRNEGLSAGEVLDELLDVYLPKIDPLLGEYIKAIDGDELTDDEAINLIEFRLNQLVYVGILHLPVDLYYLGK